MQFLGELVKTICESSSAFPQLPILTIMTGPVADETIIGGIDPVEGKIVKARSHRAINERSAKW